MKNTKSKSYFDYIAYFYFGGAIFSIFVLLNVKLLNENVLFYHPISISVLLFVTAFSLFVISYMWRVANKHDEEIRQWPFLTKFIVSFMTLIGMWILTSGILLSFILFVNCIFDTSKPETIDVEVISVSKVGNLSYARIKKKNDFLDVIRISRNSFRLLKNNKGYLRIYIKKGRLGYPWIVKHFVIE